LTGPGKEEGMKPLAEKALLYGRITTLCLISLVLAAVLGLLLHLIILVVTG
jgi:hypothetical protein